MSNRFQGRTILITGGNSGIGFATAKQIVQEGGKVIITGRDEKTLKTAQQELGANAQAIRADVGRLDEIDGLMKQVQEKYGKIQGVFANAGVAKFLPIEKVTEADFDYMFDVNVKGLFFTLQKALPLLADHSAVVLNASVAGSRGGAEISVYGATKAAVRSLGRTFSSSFVDRNIRFNVVSPGPIETPIWGRDAGHIPAAAIEATKQKMADSTPMRRNGTAEEVAAAVSFLLAPESSYILGAELFVDGGKNQI